jgi:hypothetical protein
MATESNTKQFMLMTIKEALYKAYITELEEINGV